MLFKIARSNLFKTILLWASRGAEKGEVVHTGANFKQRIADLKSAFSAFFGGIILAAAEEEMAIRRAELNKQLAEAGSSAGEPKHIHT
jgi:hypothetical protein